MAGAGPKESPGFMGIESKPRLPKDSSPGHPTATPIGDIPRPPIQISASIGLPSDSSIGRLNWSWISVWGSMPRQ